MTVPMSLKTFLRLKMMLRAIHNSDTVLETHSCACSYLITSVCTNDKFNQNSQVWSYRSIKNPLPLISSLVVV